MARKFEERVLEREGVRLRILVWPGDLDTLPVVFLPGFLGPPESYDVEAAYLAPRNVAALGLRGSPGSDCPPSGWRADDFYDDLVFLIEHLGYPRFFLSAYSANVPLALRYAAGHSERLAGLVLIDYGPEQPAARPAWAVQLRDRLPEDALRAFLREFMGYDAAPLLERVRTPVLLLRGDPEEGSLLSEADAQVMRERLPNVCEQVFPNAGHEVWEPEPHTYIEALAGFFTEVERRS
ncbi:alpha/beta hydrolase [Oceanithermus sp.]|uniref:alpha/beta fold hydrolase n=1 Tax=Oceanithermus sp. TaxID=2268145 RepID=UPI0025FF7B45|nr:alpha/beta hydrolase [Oceanithermus sp.]